MRILHPWILFGALAACAPSLSPRLERTGAVSGPHRDAPVRIAWIAPENRNVLGRPGELQEIDDAPQVLRDALVRHASSRGCVEIPTRALDSLVDRAFPDRVLTDGQAARIGSELGADLVVYGRLDAWGRGSLFGRSTTVRYRLEVVDREGVPLAHLVHGGTAAQEDPADLADSLARQGVDALDSVWGGCARHSTSP